MSVFPIVILSPAGTGAPTTTQDAHASARSRSVALRHRTFTLLSNGKPNVEYFFDGIKARLQQEGVAKFEWYEKPTVSRAIPVEIYDAVVSSPDVVITAMCD
jgi:hypothetical protein